MCDIIIGKCNNTNIDKHMFLPFQDQINRCQSDNNSSKEGTSDSQSQNQNICKT